MEEVMQVKNVGLMAVASRGFLSIVAFAVAILLTGCPAVFNGEDSEDTEDQVAEPTFSPVPGEYESSIELTIDSNESATVYYTLDGSDPNPSATQYTGTAITISETTTIKAIATTANMLDSGIAEGVYTILQDNTDDGEEEGSSETEQTGYKIIYNGNGSTGGTTPSPTYDSGRGAIVAPPGDLVKQNFVFDAWNTKADGSGTEYDPNLVAPLNLDDSDLTLYADWRNPRLIFRAEGLRVNSLEAAADDTVTLYVGTGGVSPEDATPVGWEVRGGDGTQYLFGDDFTMPSSDTIMDAVNWRNMLWEDVVISGDGETMAAVAGGGSIYISTDGGSTWNTSTGAGTRQWSSITMSDDAKYLVAVVDGGSVWLSQDSGSTWSESLKTAKDWRSITVSDDGEHLAAVADGDPTITISNDSGETWQTKDVSEKLTNDQPTWQGINSSANGGILHAIASNEKILRSPNQGGNWFAKYETQSYNDIDRSDNGQYWIAAASELSDTWEGNIFISENQGVDWEKLAPFGRTRSRWNLVTVSNDGGAIIASTVDEVRYAPNGVNDEFDSSSKGFERGSGIGGVDALSMSDSGSKALVAVNDGLLYLTSDGGATWEPLEVPDE